MSCPGRIAQIHLIQHFVRCSSSTPASVRIGSFSLGVGAANVRRICSHAPESELRFYLSHCLSSDFEPTHVRWVLLWPASISPVDSGTRFSLALRLIWGWLRFDSFPWGSGTFWHETRVPILAIARMWRQSGDKRRKQLLIDVIVIRGVKYRTHSSSSGFRRMWGRFLWACISAFVLTVILGFRHPQICRNKLRRDLWSIFISD